MRVTVQRKLCRAEGLWEQSFKAGGAAELMSGEMGGSRIAE